MWEKIRKDVERETQAGEHPFFLWNQKRLLGPRTLDGGNEGEMRKRMLKGGEGKPRSPGLPARASLQGQGGPAHETLVLPPLAAHLVGGRVPRPSESQGPAASPGSVKGKQICLPALSLSSSQKETSASD